MNNVERFIEYAKIDTQADDTTHVSPSTEKQKNLGRLLVSQLRDLGLADAYMDEYGIVYAHLSGEGEKIGFNAHIDTALEITNTGTNPKIIKSFDGNDIKLNENYSLTVSQFPSLAKHIGHDLVVTDGNTLLGADDKAGIAIIMEALKFFHDNPEVKHKNISVAFTCDEEIGEGPDHFNLEKMNADYAFTIDGSDIDCIDFENFNAKSAKVHIKGVAVHPGEGKNALINALLLANEIINEFPKGQTPYEANEDEGYWHINSINGSSAECEIDMILRDFDKEKIIERAEIVKKSAAKIQQKYPKSEIVVEIKDQYQNMKEYVDLNPKAVEIAKEVLTKNGLNPKSTKIRGGTDGATFSKMGLVTPNLGTGSYNHHGRFEYLDIQEFEKMINIVIDLMRK